MTARKTPATPQPVTVTTICSMCGLGWELHGKTPTTDDCIRLLKAELARRPFTVTIPYVQPVPYPIYPQPRPYWYGQGTWCQSVSNTAQGAQGYNASNTSNVIEASVCSPTVSNSVPLPVAA